MNHRSLFVVATLAVATLSGCMSAAQVRQSSETDLRTRASFDLQCPAEQLQLTPLNNTTDPNVLPSQYGVRGCERQATYVNVNTQTTPTWVMNNGTAG